MGLLIDSRSGENKIRYNIVGVSDIYYIDTQLNYNINITDTEHRAPNLQQQ